MDKYLNDGRAKSVHFVKIYLKSLLSAFCCKGQTTDHSLKPFIYLRLSRELGSLSFDVLR